MKEYIVDMTKVTPERLINSNLTTTKDKDLVVKLINTYKFWTYPKDYFTDRILERELISLEELQLRVLLGAVPCNSMQ